MLVISLNIGVKTIQRKVCCSNESSRLWGEPLRGDTKNGCEREGSLCSLAVFKQFEGARRAGKPNYGRQSREEPGRETTVLCRPSLKCV